MFLWLRLPQHSTYDDTFFWSEECPDNEFRLYFQTIEKIAFDLWESNLILKEEEVLRLFIERRRIKMSIKILKRLLNENIKIYVIWSLNWRNSLDKKKITYLKVILESDSLLFAVFLFLFSVVRDRNLQIFFIHFLSNFSFFQHAIIEKMV